MDLTRNMWLVVTKTHCISLNFEKLCWNEQSICYLFWSGSILEAKAMKRTEIIIQGPSLIPPLPPLSQITWRRESSSPCLCLGSCFEASLVLLIVTARWMLTALIFSCLSWPLHSPLWSIKYTSHPGQPPIQHILIFLLHISFPPLPSLSALKMLWWCCSLVLYLSCWEFNSSSIVNPYILLLMFLPSGPPYSSAKTTTS